MNAALVLTLAARISEGTGSPSRNAKRPSSSTQVPSGVGRCRWLSMDFSVMIWLRTGSPSRSKARPEIIVVRTDERIVAHHADGVGSVRGLNANLLKFLQHGHQVSRIAMRDVHVAAREGAISFDCAGDKLGHHGKECSFEAILKKYNLTGDPALVLLGKIVKMLRDAGATQVHLRISSPP